MGKGLQAVLDAVDVETFLVGASEPECIGLARALMEEIGFSDCDVLFLEHRGLGARVRLRAYVHRPGMLYAWLGKTASASGGGD